MLRPIDPGRCPVDQALELIAGKWKPMILWRLAGGRLRHAELRRALPAVLQRMLTLHLRELERDGLVDRTLFAGVPPRVEYALTAPGRALLPVLESIGHWWLASHAELRAASGGAAPHETADVRPQAANVRTFRLRG